MEKIKVGLVEDEMIIAETICLALKKLDYLPCPAADSFESAIAMIETEDPDIVLLDINLNAEKDGIDLAHYINEHFKMLNITKRVLHTVILCCFLMGIYHHITIYLSNHDGHLISQFFEWKEKEF